MNKVTYADPHSFAWQVINWLHASQRRIQFREQEGNAVFACPYVLPGRIFQDYNPLKALWNLLLAIADKHILDIAYDQNLGFDEKFWEEEKRTREEQTYKLPKVNLKGSFFSNGFAAAAFGYDRESEMEYYFDSNPNSLRPVGRKIRYNHKTGKIEIVKE